MSAPDDGPFASWCRRIVAAALVEAAKTSAPVRVSIPHSGMLAALNEVLAQCPDNNPLKPLVSFELGGTA